MKRFTVLLSAALLASAAGCDAQFDNSPQSDAELLCLEQGLAIDSDEYNNCVEGE